MSIFVKKVGKVEYYEIDGIRASGIIPYYIKNNEVKILINLEFRNTKLVHNIIGGKVDKIDQKIEDTMVREFNEETGFLISDIMKKITKKGNFLKRKIFFEKSKYMLGLLNVTDNLVWTTLPDIYDKIFDGIEPFNHRDSEQLKWVDLFDFEEDRSYLLTMAMNKIKYSNLFRKYNPKKQPLFVD